MDYVCVIIVVLLFTQLMVVGAHGTIGAVVSELVVGALSLDIELVLTLSHSIMGSHV